MVTLESNMTSSQRSTLTKQLLKNHNGTKTRYGGLKIIIPLADNYSIIYRSGSSGRGYKGFIFRLDGDNIANIRYDWNCERYIKTTNYGLSLTVQREEFHDFLRQHPPLMEWVLFHGF